MISIIVQTPHHRSLVVVLAFSDHVRFSFFGGLNSVSHSLRRCLASFVLFIGLCVQRFRHRSLALSALCSHRFDLSLIHI